MSKFLVESPHTKEDCVKAIKHVLAVGYLTHFYWGCKSGDHTGYAVLEAGSKEEASLSVPTFGRAKARVIELTQFTPAEIRAMHDS